MARTRVFDETHEETTETSADQNSNGASGWESPEATPIGMAKHKGRHTYRNGVCEKCGAIEGETKTSVPRKQGSSLAPRGKSTIGIHSLISFAWMGMGIALERQPWILQESVVEGKAPPAKAVGAVLKMESAVAGKRIDKALRGTPVYAALSKMLDAAGPWADLAPLFIPPLVIGLA